MIKKKKETLKINLSGFRKDLGDYFSKYMLTYKKQISPFIVVQADGNVCIATHTSDLKNYPLDTHIFHTWPGKYRSDVFVYTLKQLQDYVMTKPNKLKEAYLRRLRGED